MAYILTVRVRLLSSVKGWLKTTMVQHLAHLERLCVEVDEGSIKRAFLRIMPRQIGWIMGVEGALIVGRGVTNDSLSPYMIYYRHDMLFYNVYCRVFFKISSFCAG